MTTRLVCVECRCEAPVDAKGRKGYLVDSDDDPEQDEPAFYCAGCAAREFDDEDQAE